MEVATPLTRWPFTRWPRRLAMYSARVVERWLHPVRDKMVRAAVGRPHFAAMRALQPRLGVKYLNPQHLALGLTTDQRAATMIHHYDFLAAQLTAAQLGAVAGGGLDLWRADSDAGRHRLVLVFAHPTDNEGELTLSYTLAGACIAVCAFTFAPGALIGSDAATILAVTRIQGIRGALDRIRAAILSNGGVTPTAVFVAALSGIGERFGITTLAGVTARAQAARAHVDEPAFVAAYDALFATLGGSVATPIFYRLALPPSERPLSATRSGKRERTRLQRAVRAAITAAVRDALVP